jgi:hypothetical protein
MDSTQVIIYPVWNDTNVLLTKQDVKKILKKGGIKREIENLEIFQEAFIHESYCSKTDFVKYEKYYGKYEPIDLTKEENKKILPLQEKTGERLEWLGDGIPSNGAPFTAGISFPVSPTVGQFCLRTDYMPTRLFRFSGTRWIKVEDNVRMTMNNLGESDVASGNRFEGKDNRQTQKSSFFNNTNSARINGHVVEEKQSLSKALRPKADE